MDDTLAVLILKTVNLAQQPLETKEIENIATQHDSKATRVKVLYRLNNLRGEGHIRGKFIGPGKGVWIWWKAGVFKK